MVSIPAPWAALRPLSLTSTRSPIPLMDSEVSGVRQGRPLVLHLRPRLLDAVNDFFMYKTGATPTRLPDETHQYIWDEQDLPNSIVSADGSKILYGYKDASTPRQLHLVDTATGAKSFILQTSSGLYWPTLSADASLARISAGGFKASRIDLKTLAARDTASYWFDEYGTIGESAGLSDITLDNRSYFLASKKAANNAAIHRIDMAPTDFSQAPNITNIAFNRTFLPFDDTKFITVTAQLSDAKGLDNLQWVRILSLWDGVEFPEGVIYMPLWFGSGDLYDNGTHGDLVAGDGIYTNNTITIQQVERILQQEPPAQEGGPAPHRQEQGFPLHYRRHRIHGGQPGRPVHSGYFASAAGLNCLEVTSDLNRQGPFTGPAGFFALLPIMNHKINMTSRTVGRESEAILPLWRMLQGLPGSWCDELFGLCRWQRHRPAPMAPDAPGRELGCNGRPGRRPAWRSVRRCHAWHHGDGGCWYPPPIPF